jgi:hypothetical protein
MCLPTSNNSVNDHEDASVSGHEDSLVNAQVSDVRRESAGLQRKILGSWKQYSGRKFRTGILLPCFRCFPAGSGDIPASFLQDPVAGMIDLGDHGNSSISNHVSSICIVIVL